MKRVENCLDRVAIARRILIKQILKFPIFIEIKFELDPIAPKFVFTMD